MPASLAVLVLQQVGLFEASPVDDCTLNLRCERAHILGQTTFWASAFDPSAVFCLNWHFVCVVITSARAVPCCAAAAAAAHTQFLV